MALLRAEHHSVPVLFPLGEDGHAIVTSTSLSLRFRFRDVTIFVEEEILDDQTGLVSHAVRQTRGENDVGSFWLLKPGKYRVYGVSESVLECSTELLTTRESSTVSIERPLLSRVKIEPGLNTIYELSDDSDGDVEVLRSESKIQTTFSPEVVLNATTPHVSPSHIPSQPKVVASPVASIITSLMCLADRKRSKSVLSRINFDTIRLQQVDYLPPRYNGDVVFEFPPLGHHGHDTKAKLLRGMDRRYDGHAWSRTITSNIQNDLKLLFRTSSCLGHLRCDNPACDYLRRDHRTSRVNETEWEGLSEKVFEVGSKPPTGSSVVCKSCNVPPTCVAVCPAKIYYVTGTPRMTRACVHLGSHDHPVKAGDHRDFIDFTESLIGEQVERTPSATRSAIVLDTAKEVLGPLLLAKEGEPQKILELSEMQDIFDRCKHLTSPNIRNAVTTFRTMRRFGVMDSITKLRGASNWKFVQQNRFPGQGADLDKVFVFKMSEVGPGSGVDLVKRMQPGGDLENSWIMFDHVKRVRSWTTMACHVYDSTYCRVMTIAVCDMQSEDVAAQSVVWKNLNAIMAQHGVNKVNFKGFMADSAQANWNAVRIIYGSGDASEKMVDRERTCLFHWTQSLEKHTKADIRQDLQSQHRRLCQQYKNAKSMEEAETKYLAIRAWWMSSGAATEQALPRLELWLAFWHFRYRQWGGFMELVSLCLLLIFNSRSYRIVQLH